MIPGGRIVVMAKTLKESLVGPASCFVRLKIVVGWSSGNGVGFRKSTRKSRGVHGPSESLCGVQCTVSSNSGGSKAQQVFSGFRHPFKTRFLPLYSPKDEITQPPSITSN